MREKQGATHAYTEAVETSSAAPIIKDRLNDTIERGSFLPSLFVAIANTFMYSGSNLYYRRYGIRVNDWRILNAIADEPGLTASYASDVLRLDKAVVSRCVKVLVERKLLVASPVKGARRLYLTEAGATVHQQIAPLSRQREQVLTHGLSDEERAPRPAAGP